LFNILTNTVVRLTLVFNQKSYNFTNQMGFSLKALDFCQVRISEMCGTQVQSWSFCHLIDYCLNQPLLLKKIRCMLIALEVGVYYLNFLVLVLILKFNHLVQDLQPVNNWISVAKVVIKEGLRFVDIVRANFQKLSFH
jgi:hypothetical protein